MPIEKERNFREREKDSDKGRKFKMEDRRLGANRGENKSEKRRRSQVGVKGIIPSLRYFRTT